MLALFTKKKAFVVPKFGIVGILPDGLIQSLNSFTILALLAENNAFVIPGLSIVGI